MFIRLNAIQLFAHHGVYDEEVKNGNHFEIDLEVELPEMLAMVSDALTDALDYAILYKTIIAVSENRRYNLLETFANDICAKILSTFPDVKCAVVKIRKMNPIVGGPVKNVEVELQMKRQNA